MMIFLLISVISVCSALGIAYEVVWWHYERHIRACDRKLAELEQGKVKPGEEAVEVPRAFYDAFKQPF